jgi:hypothetical protein
VNVSFAVGLLACPFAAVFIQRRFLRAEPDEVA